MSSWLERHLGRIAVAALVALAATLSVGCGGGSKSASSVASSAVTTTVAASSTVTKAVGGSAGRSSAHSAPVRSEKAPARPAKAPASGSPGTVPIAGGRLLRRFAGSGNTRLGTIVVGSSEVLAWRIQRPPVQIFTANRFILVNSHASTGDVRLSRGTYPGVRIAAKAAWTIELRTQSR
jgi:hypothetical protein